MPTTRRSLLRYTIGRCGGPSAMCLFLSSFDPAVVAIHACDIQVHVGLGDCIGRGRDVAARTAFSFCLLNEHLLNFRGRGAAANGMGRRGSAAIGTRQNDEVVVVSTLHVGGPDNLGGGDGAAVAELVEGHVDVAVGLKGDGPHAHGLASTLTYAPAALFPNCSAPVAVGLA